MKNNWTILNLLFLVSCSTGWGQLLPGTLTVQGAPFFQQDVASVVLEAGESEANTQLETSVNASEIGFVLNPSSLPPTSSELNCTGNIYRYSVFVHYDELPELQGAKLEARTFTNSGDRFPPVIIYDALLIQPLGPRNLYPENGGAYIEVPNDGAQAIKIMEFVGCRQNIPIQFRLSPTLQNPSGTYAVDIHYTVVGRLF